MRLIDLELDLDVFAGPFDLLLTLILREEVEQEFDGSGYGAFKQAVAHAVVAYLEPVRTRYEELRADEEGLERTLAEGAEKARAIASQTVQDVREAMGVGPVRQRR